MELNFTIYICVLTVITSLLAFNNRQLYSSLVLIPYNVVHRGRWYTVFGSGLIHKDYMHLLFNMFTLYCFGPEVQRNVGGWRYLVIYFAGMALADIPTIIKYKDNPGYGSLGASGAISAVLFSYILFNPFNKLYLFFLPIGLPAILFGVLYLVYSMYMARRGAGGINHDAHFFGAVAGMGLTILLKPEVLQIFIMQLQYLLPGY